MPAATSLARRMLTAPAACLVAPAWAADAAGTSALAALGPWMFGSVAMLAVGVAAFLLGGQRSARRLQGSLHASQLECRLLGQLQEAWRWETDAAHRLLHMHPPAGGTPTARPVAEIGSALWTCFDVAATADVAGLRARLESQVPFSDLRVREAGHGAGWLLRAAPRFDLGGRFTGYTGTARPTDEADTLLLDQRALAALLGAAPGPALVLGAASPGQWRLRHANADAKRLLDGDGQAVTTGARDWLAALPAPVRQVLDAPVRQTPDAPVDSAAAVHEGWRLHPLPQLGGTVNAWLLTRPPAAGLPADGQADGDSSRSESESFSFTVSHDLRAPIRVVEGFTRILKEDYGRQIDRVGNDHLDRVLGAAARMNHMIDALLTLARLSSLPLARQPVNLSQLAGFIVDDLRRGAPERTADIQIEPGLQVEGDPTLLRLVLENLLGNAWKYSARTKRTQIIFGAEQHEGRRAFVVRDNGAGFDMRSADRLFGLFQRLHSATDFPGTGVGLASVKRIVRRHGGDIWADAEPGRGAAFHFTLRE
jgi:signal transduction histidine kinase